eukprot:TRINITY_DN3423_c0_g1_i2.p1 TRINITY_DN3423_c0_g1~~TRINITY_DN3423_c0_g1_i2.p1  ORF type:complete len:262 (-),score=56.29 TRINITY_DN3423_c0_g1_i2:56-841(-)
MFIQNLSQCLQNKAWERLNEDTTAVVETEETLFSTRNAGISGLLRYREERNKEVNSNLEEAFSDLKALMSNASEMVTLAEKLQAYTAKNKDEQDEVNNMIFDIGLASPVTKQSAGNLFHVELSRQICEFFEDKLDLAGGIMALTDVYCIYNRARGTALISPDDLYRACLLFEQLNLPMMLRKFDSGLLVVQTTNYNDDLLCERINMLVEQDMFPMTAMDLGTRLQMSLTLAQHVLLKAEERGILCRDDSFEGLVFYQNIFL